MTPEEKSRGEALYQRLVEFSKDLSDFSDDLNRGPATGRAIGVSRPIREALDRLDTLLHPEE